MNNEEIDALRRELLIASLAAVRLGRALQIAWAGLSQGRGFDSVSANEEAVSPLSIKNEEGAEPLSKLQEELFE